MIALAAVSLSFVRAPHSHADLAAVEPSDALTFGTGHAGVEVSDNETTVFTHKINDGHVGVLTHFWSTCGPEVEAGLLVRYYVDGETTASIAFTPPLAAGVGFDDAEMAPWGTRWFGLGAGGKRPAGQAWFHNFKVPFRSSIVVTVQSPSKTQSKGFYIILRGGLDLGIDVGGVRLPDDAKLELQVFEGAVKPLAFVDVAHVPAGRSGLVFASTIAVNNSGIGGVNFLEGCLRLFDPPTQAWPGTLLATGTEDFYDSGWYFNAGGFEMPVSGMTHLITEKNKTEWSAYRVQDMDPLRFSDGVRFTWRCGDVVSHDPAVGKCYTEAPSEGRIVGNPTCDHVTTYAWVYSWPRK